MSRRLLLLVFVALASAAGLAHEFQLQALKIGHPYARATPPGATSAGAFLRIQNTGTAADRLLRVASPIAGTVEVHEMKVEGGVMRMRAVAGIDIEPGATVMLAPGGYHVMLLGLKQPLAQGEKFPLTLTFEKAGSIDVVVNVQAMTSTGHHGSAKD